MSSVVFNRNWTPAEGMIPALSFRQPWAWVVAKGIKPIENRNWPTEYRGLFLIHAGKTWDGNFWTTSPKHFHRGVWENVVNSHTASRQARLHPMRDRRLRA